MKQFNVTESEVQEDLDNLEAEIAEEEMVEVPTHKIKTKDRVKEPNNKQLIIN